MSLRGLWQPGLEHVESFDDEDIGLPYGLLFVGEEIVGQVRVDRGADPVATGFDISEELYFRATPVP
jgi:hypothetical protein